MNDDFLIEQVLTARGGDHQAYCLLMDRYYNPVYLYCLGIIGNVHDAEDIAQDVFLQGYAKLGQLKHPERFVAWLGRIAKNKCKEHLRKRRSQMNLDYAPPHPQDEDTAQQELHELISRMPKEYRIPLVMYYFDGRNVKTVAELMQISVSSAYSRIRDATKLLKDLFEK